MARVTWEKGRALEIDGDTWTMLRMVTGRSGREWQLENRTNGRIRVESHYELEDLWVQGRLEFLGVGKQRILARDKRPLAEQFEKLPEKLKAEVKARYAFVREVHDHRAPFSEPVIQPIIDRVWRRMRCKVFDRPPCYTTVWRWYERWVNEGYCINALIPRHYRKGRRPEWRHPRLLEFVNDAVEEIYLDPSRGTLDQTHNAACAAVLEENDRLPLEAHIPKPTKALVKANIAARSKFDVFRARYGESDARRKFRGVRGSIAAFEPLERAEIDHTRMNMLVIDDRTGLPRGRPWITVMVDVYTRCVLGMWIDFSAPSYMSVAKCLKHAVMPKTDLKEQYPSVVGVWGQRGAPFLLSVDNGKDFHDKDFRDSCRALNIELLYNERRTPWHKPYIERYFGSHHDGVTHGVPGSTFRNAIERGSYDSEGETMIMLSTLKEMSVKWVVDVYHQREHKSLLMSPSHKWDISVRPEDLALPPSVRDLESIVGRWIDRRLDQRGVVVENLWYGSAALEQLRRRIGSELKVDVMYDPENLERVYVADPETGELLQADSLCPDYTADGLNLWQHQTLRKILKNEGLQHIDEDALIRARAELRRMVVREVARFGPNSRVAKKLAHRFPEDLEESKGRPSRRRQQPKAASAKPSPDHPPEETPYAPVSRRRQTFGSVDAPRN